MPAQKKKTPKLVTEKVEEVKAEEIKSEEVKPEEVKVEEVSQSPMPVVEPPVVTETPLETQAVSVEPGNLARQIDSLNKIVDGGAPMEGKSDINADKTDVNKPKIKSSVGKTIMAFLAGLILGIGVGFVVWGWLPNMPANETKTPEKMVEKPKETPTPTINSDNLDKTSIKMLVLNGTGGKGVAAKAKEILTAAGYSQVTTGNAEESDYTVTKISIKDSKSDFLEGIKATLKNDYALDEKTEEIAESEAMDVVVIVGTE